MGIGKPPKRRKVKEANIAIWQQVHGDLADLIMKEIANQIHLKRVVQFQIGGILVEAWKSQDGKCHIKEVNDFEASRPRISPARAF